MSIIITSSATLSASAIMAQHTFHKSWIDSKIIYFLSSGCFVGTLGYSGTFIGIISFESSKKSYFLSAQIRLCILFYSISVPVSPKNVSYWLYDTPQKCEDICFSSISWQTKAQQTHLYLHMYTCVYKKLYLATKRDLKKKKWKACDTQMSSELLIKKWKPYANVQSDVI